MKKFILFIVFLLSSFFLMADDDCSNFYSVVSPDGNYIYFSSDRHGGSYEIYRVDIDGYSNPIRLTFIPEEYQYYLAVSPDGSLIAFQSGVYDSGVEIYIMNSDGSNLIRLTDNDYYDGRPNFSPDGTKIIFESLPLSRYDTQIFTMNIDGSERTQLTDESGGFVLSGPIYNPSGTKIYFRVGLYAENLHYMMMDLDGTNWVDITEPNEYGYSEWGLHFNEDGSKIIFSTSEWVGGYNGGDIVIADADGSNWNKVTNSTDGILFSYPFICSTNDKIYYSFYWGNEGNIYSIHRMNMDGTNDLEISNCYGVGIEDNFETQKNIISPNPTNGIINVDYDEYFILEIYDLDGRLLVKTSNNKIDVSHLSSGVYNIRLFDAYNIIIKSEKFVKQ